MTADLTNSRLSSTVGNQTKNELRFGIKFVGYAAYVIALKGPLERPEELDYAILDFVSGGALLHGDEGFVSVPKRSDLAPFVSSLRPQIDFLLTQQEAARGTALNRIDVSFGANKISFEPAADLQCLVAQLEERGRAVRKVLKEVERVGAAIVRRPYDEYIDELSKTGFARVEGYGFGLFENGKLYFRSERRAVLVRPTNGNDAFQVYPINEAVDPVSLAGGRTH
jgi:hypothetical protein